MVQDRGLHNDVAPRGMMTDAYRAALDLFWQAWAERETKRGRNAA